MGTSSSYGGPTGPSALLPPWAQQPPVELPAAPTPTTDAPIDPAAPVPPQPSPPAPPLPKIHLLSAKRAMTSFAKSGGGGAGSGALRRAGSRYVTGRGGGRSASRAASAGRATTGAFGQFLGDVRSRGLEATLRERGLSEYLGQSAQVVLTAIANMLAPAGALLEEAAARRAVTEALYELFDTLEIAGDDLTPLDAMTPEVMRSAVEFSVVAYVYNRWLEEVGDRIERNAVSPDVAARLEREVREYVETAVRLDLRQVDVERLDWRSSAGTAIVERIYAEAYGFLEGA